VLNRSLGIAVRKVIRKIADTFKTETYTLHRERIAVLQKDYGLLIVFA